MPRIGWAVGFATVVAALGFGAPGAVAGQGSEAPFGPTPDTSEELLGLEYLVGEWIVRSFDRDASARFVESPVTSSFRARFLYDGLSMLTEYYGERRDGFYGVHLISLDPDRGLVHHYLNARVNRRLEFLGEHDGAAYHLTRRGGYGGGEHLYRESDRVLGPDSFEKRTFRSDDDGATWQETDYCFVFDRRSSDAPPGAATPDRRGGCTEAGGRERDAR